MNKCKVCGESKEDMDVHSKVLCKECWSIKYDIKAKINSWKTRYERYGLCGHKGYYKGKKVLK